MEQRTQEAEKRAQCAEEKVKIDFKYFNILHSSSNHVGRYFYWILTAGFFFFARNAIVAH